MQQKGITIISLVITIILLLILSSIGIGVGINSIKSTTDSVLTSELIMVQHATLEQYTKYKKTNDKAYLVGNKMNIEEVKDIANQMGISLVNIPNTYENSDYYKLDKASLIEMGIQNSKDEYIINYITGEVFNITQKATSNHQPLYVKANSFYTE